MAAILALLKREPEQGIDPEEIITAVRTRRPPMMSASAGLKL
jgi:hypothetical protein